MNTHQLLQYCLLAVSLVGAAVCLAAVLAYHFRNQLRELHERWLGLGPLGRFATLGLVTVFVGYGGTKSPTNDLAGASGSGATGTGATGVSPVASQAGTTGTGAMGVSPVAGWVSDGQDARRPSAFRPSPMMATSSQLTNQQTNQLNNWTARGAYSDWQRIDFPDGFAFPHGTNLLTSVTLFAWGELRESFHQLTTNNRQLTTLPTAVSLESAVSSVTYGLTPSNSFLIAWQNACVNRSPTNRVDASIELFPSGVCSVRFGASQTDYPPITPPGFVGSGQDTNWLASVFSPTDYTQITNKGYDAWLSEDYVGVNEQNGLYKASITINPAPSTLHQAPLYLVCGPYKVVVTSPGTYSFPLEVFKHYRTRTYPVALPLSISTDDGYRDNLAPALLSYACCSPTSASNAQFPTPSLLSGSSVQPASRPRLALSAPPDVPPEYDIYEEPRLVLSPSSIPLSQAAGTVISIWCNITEGARRLYTSLSGWTTVTFRCPSEAEIEESMVEDAVEFILETSKGSCSGTVYIEDETDGCCWDCCGPDCWCDGTCCDCTCGCHD